MIPTNPFGKRKFYAKSIPANCRVNYPVIVPAAPSQDVTAVQPPPPMVSNKNKVRIGVQNECSSDEEPDVRFGGHRSRDHLSEESGSQVTDVLWRKFHSTIWPTTRRSEVRERERGGTAWRSSTSWSSASASPTSSSHSYASSSTFT